MARGLLAAMVMDTPPGQVIRTLREALQMSQAEFARALDWSPSTISAWERGRAEPSRLAFKIILAFAEQRGVRYRPRAASRSLVPAIRPRVALPAPAAPAALPHERFVTVTADRPRWSAEATFRVTRPAPTGERRVPASALGTLGIAVATLCAGLALGLPGSPGRSVPPPAAMVTPSDPPATRVGRSAARLVGPATVVPSTGTAGHAVRAAVSAPALARLDGLVLVGGRRRATFRTEDDSVTVPEGSRLGAQRVAVIARDGVELIDPQGEARTIRLGHRAALE